LDWIVLSFEDGYCRGEKGIDGLFYAQERDYAGSGGLSCG